MKLLTLNFLTCARKTCKATDAAFPLHPRDAELEQIETELNPLLIRNLLPRLEWAALRGLAEEIYWSAGTILHLAYLALPHRALLTVRKFEETDVQRLTVNQLGLPTLPLEPPAPEDLMSSNSSGPSNAEAEPTQTLRDLHVLLLETSIESGKLACGNCGHEYAVKEGIANFLLPGHMV